MPAYLPTPFHGLDQRADPRVVGKAGVEVRLVRVVQHVHDVRAADAGRIVEPRLVEAARLEVRDALSATARPSPPWCRS